MSKLDVLFYFMCNLLQYNMDDVGNTFVAKPGDHVGWTLLDTRSVFVFYYNSSQKIYFHKLGSGDPPTVGSVVQFGRRVLPVVFSIAALLDFSELTSSTRKQRTHLPYTTHIFAAPLLCPFKAGLNCFDFSKFVCLT